MSYFSDSTVCMLFVLILVVGFFLGLATAHSSDPSVVGELHQLEDEFSHDTFNMSWDELSMLISPEGHYRQLVVELRVQNYLQIQTRNRR